MYTENTIQFDEDLIGLTGYQIWVHSRKGRFMRIGIWAGMALLLVLGVIFLLRSLVLKVSVAPLVITLILMLLLFIVLAFAMPLLYIRKTRGMLHPGTEQNIAMDEHFVNVYAKNIGAQYKWFNFTDIAETANYYFMFTPEVFIVLDKKGFPEGGEEVFRHMHTPARLLKEAARKPLRERCYVPFEKDYVTPLEKKFRGSRRK